MYIYMYNNGAFWIASEMIHADHNRSLLCCCAACCPLPPVLLQHYSPPSVRALCCMCTRKSQECENVKRKKCTNSPSYRVTKQAE